MLPEMKIPEIDSFEKITQLARTKVSSGKKVRTALAGVASLDSLRALVQATEDRLILPIVIAGLDEFERAAAALEIDAERFPIISPREGQTVGSVICDMAVNGQVDLIIDGTGESEVLLSETVAGKSGFVAKGAVVSQVSVVKPQSYKKLMILSDGGAVPEPDLKAKVAIAQNMVSLSHAMGIDQPRIAVLAAVEVVYPQMRATTEAAVLAKMAERNQIKGAHIDGPLSFDVAVDMCAAHSKGITTSEVAGQADGFLFSRMEVARGVYDAMSVFGKAETGSVIIGGKVPIAVASSKDSVESRYNSLLLGALTVL